MMSEHSRLRRAVHKIEALHATTDLALGAYHDHPDSRPSCKEGCYGCCFQLVATSLIECIPIAASCLGDAVNRIRLDKNLPELKRHADLLQNPGMNTERWFLGEHPCIFLVENRCSIYPWRPTACRTMVVESDPVQCYPEGGLQEVRFVDFSKTNRMYYSALLNVARNLGLPHECNAPMPIAMLWAVRVVTQGLDAFRKSVYRTPYVDRITNIQHWAKLQAHVKEQDNALHTETAPGGATPVGQA